MKKLFVLVIISALVAYGFWALFIQKWRGNDNLKYINTKHSYSFQYSPDWNLMGDPQDDVVMLYNTDTPPGDGGVPAGVKVDIMFLENYDDLSLEDWIEQMSQGESEQEVFTEENTTVDGIEAIRRTFSPTFVELGEGAPTSIYFMKENYIIMINYLGREPDYNLQRGNFEMMLATFNFK